MELIKKVYHNKLFTKVFPTMVSCLREELADCETVLDLGCGPDSPLQHCKNVKYSLGVEAFKEYLNRSRDKNIHDEYDNSMIQDLKFPKNSFDAVILMEVVEHLSKKDGIKVLKLAEKWAAKKVIVSTPNDYIDQNAIDGNELQKHLSGWTVKEFNDLGYSCRGLAGLKALRTEKEEDTMDDNILVSIKYEPKIFWFGVSTLSQALTYYLPNYSFGLFCVKNLK